MADLDDFFAKKDRKKKSKKGFSKANTEVLAKNLEENERKEQEAEEKANDASRAQRIENDSALVTENDADEWKEYEEMKRDYSNLKIDALKADNGDAEENVEEEELDEDGEKVNKVKAGGPWSKLVSGNAADSNENLQNEEQLPEPPTVVKKEPSAPETAPGEQRSAYVIPHLRRAAPASSTVTPTVGGPRGSRKTAKHAPDISSEIFFPSLSAAMGTDDPNRGQSRSQRERGFEEVKSGGSGTQHNTSAAPKLALDNKFAALRD